MKKTAAILALIMALSLSACNSDTDGAGTNDNGAAQVHGDDNSAKNGKVTKEKETEETTIIVTRPAGVEFIVPAAEDFEYEYDEELGGIHIKKYKGDEEAVLVPSEIDGSPVKLVSFVGNLAITLPNISLITKTRLIMLK